MNTSPDSAHGGGAHVSSTHAATGNAGTSSPRWWLDPAQAQKAFGSGS
jgi:hypothetical protein